MPIGWMVTCITAFALASGNRVKTKRVRAVMTRLNASDVADSVKIASSIEDMLEIADYETLQKDGVQAHDAGQQESQTSKERLHIVSNHRYSQTDAETSIENSLLSALDGQGDGAVGSKEKRKETTPGKPTQCSTRPRDSELEGGEGDKPWLESGGFWYFSMMSCVKGLGNQGPKNPVKMITFPAGFIPTIGGYVSRVANLSESRSVGAAAAHTVDLAAFISVGILTGGLSGMVQTVAGVLNKVLGIMNNVQNNCLKCFTGMMMQYPDIPASALRATGWLSEDNGTYTLCGLSFEAEPSILDIALKWSFSVNNFAAKLTQLVLRPAWTITSMFSWNRANELNDAAVAAGVVANSIVGGLELVKEHQSSAEVLKFSEVTGLSSIEQQRSSAETMLCACFDKEDDYADMRTWWHSTLSEGVVPGIQDHVDLLIGVSWDELAKKHKLREAFEEKLSIKVCPAINFQNAKRTLSG